MQYEMGAHYTVMRGFLEKMRNLCCGVNYMQIYLVGGAVRDELLGRPVKERDWVVVGATEDEMLALKFKKVGRDFPVFLHPETGEEYALARTERKTGRGYTEFACYAAPTVTLEEDLRRRDLTINAIAQAPDGTLIDPFGGVADLQSKVLRHVSPAFVEDPLRVLRVARFAATFGDFTLHPTTCALMCKMAASGELDALVPERVWQEVARALATEQPQRFFVTLQECGALERLFLEIATQFTAAMTVLRWAARLNSEVTIRFAALAGAVAFGVATAPTTTAVGEKIAAENVVSAFSKRYRIPHDCADLAKLVVRYKNNYEGILAATAEEILHLLEALDVLRRLPRAGEFIAACESVIACADGREFGDAEQEKSAQRICVFHEVYNAIKSVNVKELLANLPPECADDGVAIKEVIKNARLTALEFCIAKSRRGKDDD